MKVNSSAGAQHLGVVSGPPPFPARATSRCSHKKNNLKAKTHTHTLEVPRKIKPGRRVIHAACGHYHSLLVGAGGELLATGRGGDGQLGLPGRRNKETFTQVNSGAVFCRRVLSVAAGDTHSLALLGEGQVASWGWNGDKQLGRVIDDDDDEALKQTPANTQSL